MSKEAMMKSWGLTPSDNEPLRVCRKCGKEAWNTEELEGFSKNNRMIHGRGTICKKCDAEKSRKYQRENYIKSNNPGGFREDLDSVLYYVKLTHKVTGEEFYKIGITNRSVKERFSTELAYVDLEVIMEEVVVGKVAKALEKLVLGIYARHLVSKDKQILAHTGNTEIFEKNVLDWI